MRKSLILFLCLLLLMIGGLGAAAITVTTQETAVSTEGTCYYGDPEYAEGIRVHERVRSMNRMFWTVDMELGEDPSATATLEVTGKDVYEEYDWEQFTVYVGIDEGIQLYSDEYYQNDISKLISSLVKELPNGQQSTIRVKLSDYFDYYPLEADIWGNTGIVRVIDAASDTTVTPGNSYTNVTGQLRDYLRIPVLEEHAFNITVFKDESGNIESFYQDYPDGTDGVGFSSCSCGTDSRLFFTIDNKSWNGEILDTSLIPGGYGIYSIPCTVNEDATEVYPDKISTVYSLDERENVRSLITTRDGKSVLCFTFLDEGRSFLTVLEPDTGALRQRFELKGATDELTVWYVREQADGSIICTDSDNVLLIEKTADGLYEQTAAVEEPYTESAGYDEETGYWHYNRTELASHFPVGIGVTNLYEEHMAIKRDGDRLIIADPATFNSKACGVILIVYEKGEPVYLGYYSSSLDVDLSGVYTEYDRACRLDGVNSLTISVAK